LVEIEGVRSDLTPPHLSAFPLRSDANGAILPSKREGYAMARPTNDVLGGTLDLLILKALSWGPAHGYAVARWIEQATDDALAIGEGTLYPALHRLEERAWVTASWGTSENNRRAKFYELTQAGEARLREESKNWRRYAEAVFAALESGARP
jgi:transcriptional regulator